MLENQLYKNAASLEAYLDRSTLKGRLGKLASAITSHYKQAMDSRRPCERSSATTSIPSLGYEEGAFAETKLRRSSSESTPLSKASSVPPMTTELMRGESDSVFGASGSTANHSLSATSGPLNSLSEIPNDKGNNSGKNKTPLRGNTSANNPLLGPLSSNNNIMLNAGGRIQPWATMNNMMMGSGMNDSMNSGMGNAMNNAMGGGLGGMGNGVGSGINNAMGGGMNSGMLALHQLQHQQRALMMQQQQQNMSSMGMVNLAALQQQQQQRPNGVMSMPNANAGMNMVNMSALPNVIPGGGGAFPSFPMNNGNNASMPPPQPLNGMSTPGSGNASNDGTSPLSPGSFHW